MAATSSTTAATPLVSIGMPLYNAGRYVRRTLEMIAAQTFQDYELVIVDNGSRDETGTICREFAAKDPRIRYHRFEHTIPLVANFCRARDLSRGTYFLWQAADDWRPADAIARAVAVFEKYPDTVLVHGPVDLVIPNGEPVSVANRVEAISADAAERVATVVAQLQHNAMLYGLYGLDALRRAVFRQHRGQDTLVLYQMAQLGPIRRLSDPLVRYRHTAGPLDDPLGSPRRLSLRELAAWPTVRFKCLLVFARGVWYLGSARGVDAVTRARVTRAFTGAFLGRYGSHLARELALLVVAPAAIVFRPVVVALKAMGVVRPRETASAR